MQFLPSYRTLSSPNINDYTQLNSFCHANWVCSNNPSSLSLWRFCICARAFKIDLYHHMQPGEISWFFYPAGGDEIFGGTREEFSVRGNRRMRLISWELPRKIKLLTKIILIKFTFSYFHFDDCKVYSPERFFFLYHRRYFLHSLLTFYSYRMCCNSYAIFPLDNMEKLIIYHIFFVNTTMRKCRKNICCQEFIWWNLVLKSWQKRGEFCVKANRGRSFCPFIC